MNDNTQRGGASPILLRNPKSRRRKSPQKSSEQPFQPELPLFKPRLQIVSCPISERVDPRENSFILTISPYGTRACGGQFSAVEVHEIARLTKRWDFALDENQRPRCLPRLEALLDQICRRSFTKQNTEIDGEFSKQNTEKAVNNILSRGGES